MKKVRLVTLALMVALLASLSALSALAETQQGVLGTLKGEYEELFPVLNAEEYNAVWLENCAKVVGDEAAQATADMLRGMVVGELTGQAAIDAYAEKPDETKYNCFFLQDVARFQFDGNKITGLGKDGEEVFSHTYTYLNSDNELGFAIYQSNDADSGEFAYFAFLPDTPETTYHIEFRYGSDAEALTKTAEGPYAYWIAAGIPVDRDETIAPNAIALFCSENLAESEAEDAA